MFEINDDNFKTKVVDVLESLFMIMHTRMVLQKR